jgi:hypothetical protein
VRSSSEATPEAGRFALCEVWSGGTRTCEHQRRHGPGLVKVFLLTIQADALQLVDCARKACHGVSSAASARDNTEEVPQASPILAKREVVVPKTINPPTDADFPSCSTMVEL